MFFWEDLVSPFLCWNILCKNNIYFIVMFLYYYIFFFLICEISEIMSVHKSKILYCACIP